MGNCIVTNNTKVVNPKVGLKKKRTVETSTHIDQRVFEIRAKNVKKIYTVPIIIKSPPIKESDCIDSDAASDYSY